MDDVRIIKTISMLLPIVYKEDIKPPATEAMDLNLDDNKIKIWLTLDQQGYVNMMIKNKEKSKTLLFKLEVYLSSNLVSRQKLTFDPGCGTNLGPLEQKCVKLGSVELSLIHI